MEANEQKVEWFNTLLVSSQFQLFVTEESRELLMSLAFLYGALVI